MISVYLGIAGISQALWTLLLFPPLQRRFGTGGVLRGCYYLWPIQFIILPLCNVFLRQGWISPFWAVSVITNVLSSGVAMAFSKSSPGHAYLDLLSHH